MNDIFKIWIEGQDLFILDDITSIYGIASKFFEEAFKYVHFSSKALLVTSNYNISNLFEKQYPLNFNYKCVLILNSKEKESIREPWIKNISNFSNNEEALKTLANYTGGQGAGILIKVTENKRSLQQEYGNEYTKLSPKENKEKIRYAEEPYKEGWELHDLYLHGVENYDVVIMKVFDIHEAQSLLNIVDKAHSYGIKVIVLCRSIEKFKSLIKQFLSYSYYKKRNVRLYDRIRVIFPGIQ